MFELLLFDAIVVMCLFIYWIVVRSRRRIDRIPGPRIYPVIGNLPDLIRLRRGVLEYLQECREKYGVIFRLRVLGKTFVIISDPGYIRTVLSSSENLTRPFYLSVFEDWLGIGLSSSTGAVWHSQRKVLEPTFSTLKIKLFIPSIVERCENMCSNLRRFDGQEINLLLVLRDLTVKLAYDHFFNVTLDESRLREVANDNGEMMYFLTNRLLRPWLWNDFLYSWTTNAWKEKLLIEKLRGISLEAITTNKRKNKENLDGRTRISFLDYLVDYQKEDSSLSDEEIRTQLDNLVFGAMNTLPMALSAILHFVGSNDSLQDDVRQEINSIFAQPLSSERVPTMDQLLQLKYLESVVNETFRFTRPPPAVGRFISKEILLGNYSVLAGSSVLVDWNAVHHDEKYYSTPYEFNPGHFYNPEEVEQRPSYAFLPFGKSLRICIAEKYSRMLMKLVLVVIIQNFRIESTQSIEALMKLQLQGVMNPNDRAKSIFVKIKNINSN